MVCDRHHSAHRNDREDEQGGQESQVRRQLEHETVCLIGQQVLLEEQLDAVGQRLEDAVGAGAVRSDPVLHVGDDLALEPDGQHHRDEEHPERDEDLDSDDDHRAEVNPVGKKRIWHQITFSTSSPTTLTEQSMSAEAPVS